DDRVGQADLVVELQHPRLDGQGAGGSTWLSGLVDDPHRDAEPGQPEREDETGGSGPDDQDRAVSHHSLTSSFACPAERSPAAVVGACSISVTRWAMLVPLREREEEKGAAALRPHTALNYGNRSC